MDFLLVSLFRTLYFSTLLRHHLKDHALAFSPNSNVVSQRLSSVFTFGAVRQNPYEPGSPGVTMVYRGYDEALTRSHPAVSDTDSKAVSGSKQAEGTPLPMGDGITAPGPAIPEGPRRHLHTNPPGRSASMGRQPSVPYGESEGEYTDLILIVHGIGQGVRDSNYRIRPTASTGAY